MNQERINQLANFFYSSDSTSRVPLRLACSTGQYSGFDIKKEALIDLLNILSTSSKLKKDLMAFRKKNDI